MAHHSQTTDEHIAALATSLNEILKVHGPCTSSHSSSTYQQSFDAVGLPYQLPISSSLICSSDLSLVQFKISVTQPQSTTAVVPSSCQNQTVGLVEKNDNKAEYQAQHILLCLDGTSASSSCMKVEGAATTLDLEVVELALISDKFPLSTIPIERCPRDTMFLVKFWADINFEDGSTTSEQAGIYRTTTMFESSKVMSITCKTSVCSFGRSIGDKVEKLSGIQVAPNRVVYQSVGAPLCDYLVNFIRKLKECDQVATMNGVLENFSVIQVVSNDATHEVLLGFLYIFEVSPPTLSATTGAMCSVYRLDCTK